MKKVPPKPDPRLKGKMPGELGPFTKKELLSILILTLIPIIIILVFR